MILLLNRVIKEQHIDIAYNVIEYLGWYCSFGGGSGAYAADIVLEALYNEINDTRNTLDAALCSL